MSKKRLKCTEADCDWVTEEAEVEEAEYYMDTYVKLHHAPVQPTRQTTSATLPVSRLKCTEAGCDWVTEEAEFEEAEYYMDTHVRLHHAPIQPTLQTTSATLFFFL